MNVTVIASTPDIEHHLERCGRISYRTEPKGDPGRFLRARIREGHESILEHASITFDVSGISRSCLAQFTRHRHLSFTVESMRYVSMDEAGMVVPDAIRNDAEAWAHWRYLEYTSRRVYKRCRELGIRKEDARFALPIATETSLVVTGNCRAWRHVFKTRCDKAAQWEIRALATEMLRLAYGLVPAVFEDLAGEFLKGEVGQ